MAQTDGGSLLNADNSINPDALQAWIQASGAGVAAGPTVYFGQVGPEPGGPKGMQTVEYSPDQAKQDFYGWPPMEQQAWANKLYRAGIISDPSDYDAAFAQWSSAVDFAAGQYTYGGKKITPWDVMQSRIGISTKQKSQPKTSTNTTTTAQVLSNGDANAMINAMYQNELGRNPTDGELSRYRSMLINKVAANPTVTTTTQTTTGSPTNRNTKTNNVNSGGVSSTELNDSLQSGVQADPEYGAYQAATTYMGALQSLFSGSPDLTGSNG